MRPKSFLSGCAGIAISWTLFLSSADAQPATVHLVATPQQRQFEPAAIKAGPNLKCDLHVLGESPDSGVTVLTDADGYARFYAVRAVPGTRPETLSCTDQTGKVSSQKGVDDSLQLSIYALACRDALGYGTPDRVTLYFTVDDRR